MKRQQGVALITILVMVALATILAASIVKHQSNTAQNTGYLIRQNQSLLYAKSAEAFFPNCWCKMHKMRLKQIIQQKSGLSLCHRFRLKMVLSLAY